MQKSFIRFDGTKSVFRCRERKVGKCFCESRKDGLCFVFYDRELMNELPKSFDRAFQREGGFFVHSSFNLQMRHNFFFYVHWP